MASLRNAWGGETWNAVDEWNGLLSQPSRRNYSDLLPVLLRKHPSPRSKHDFVAPSPEIYRHQDGNYEQCGTKFPCHISGFAVFYRKRIEELLNECIVACNTTPGHKLPDLSLIHVHKKLMAGSNTVNKGR